MASATSRVLCRPGQGTGDRCRARRSGGGGSRRRLLAAAAVLLPLSGLAVVTGGAGATTPPVTSSTITSPPNDSFYLDSIPVSGTETGNGIYVTISGTTNGTTSDEVDLLCYQDNGSTGNAVAVIERGVPLAPDGSFVANAPLTPVDGKACTIRAVPTSDPTTGLSAFAGPRVAVSYLKAHGVIGGPNAGLEYDYYLYGAGLQGADDFDSAGSCGLDASYAYDPAVFGSTPGSQFNCNDYFQATAASNGSTSGIVIDQVPAYTPAEAEGINASAPGLQPLQVSVSQVPTSGDITITETDPLLECRTPAGAADTTFPPTSADCASFAAAPVVLHRTMLETDGGKIVSIDDSWQSTDGNSHAVALRAENSQYFSGGTNNQLIEYRLPGQSSYSDFHTLGAGAGLPALPSGSGTILVQDENITYPDAAHGAGAITYASAPTSLALDAAAPADGQFDAVISGIATGSAPFTQLWAYTTDVSPAAVQSDLPIAEDIADPPAISVTAPPADATESSSSITVSGSASAGSGVDSVTVDGTAAALAAAGATTTTWSATVGLAVGSDTLTAVVRSASGATATTTPSVTYAPPPTTTTTSTTSTTTTTTTLPPPPVVHLEAHRVDAARGVVLLRLACSGSACSGRLTLLEHEVSRRIVAVHRGRKLTHRTRITRRTVRVATSVYRLSPGTTASLRLHLDGQAQRALVSTRAHRLALAAEALPSGGKETSLGAVVVREKLLKKLARKKLARKKSSGKKSSGKKAAGKKAAGKKSAGKKSAGKK